MKTSYSICLQLKNEHGQTLAEYALILLLLALVVALVIPGVATSVSNSYTAMAEAFPP